MSREILLYVDYGNKRVNFYYAVRTECSAEKTDWCYATFGGASWFYTRVNGPSAYYFTKKKNATWFALKWTGNLTSTE